MTPQQIREKYISFHKQVLAELFSECTFLHDPNDPDYFWGKSFQITKIRACSYYDHESEDMINSFEFNDGDVYVYAFTCVNDPKVYFDIPNRKFNRDVREKWNDISEQFEFNKFLPLIYAYEHFPSLKFTITKENGLQFIE
jgi:hypothetical protein